MIITIAITYITLFMSLRFWNTFYILSQIQTCPQIALCETGAGFPLVLQDMIFLALLGLILSYILHPAHMSVCEHYLNAMRMKAGASQNSINNTSRKPACALILF